MTMCTCRSRSLRVSNYCSLVYVTADSRQEHVVKSHLDKVWNILIFGG